MEKSMNAVEPIRKLTVVKKRRGSVVTKLINMGLLVVIGIMIKKRITVVKRHKI